MEIGDIYIYEYIVRETSLYWRGHDVMWAELRTSHFYNSNHWKRTLKIVFKGSGGSGCFQFPEAVVTLQ